MTAVRWYLTVLLAPAACAWLLIPDGMAAGHEKKPIQLPAPLANADQTYKRGGATEFLHALVNASSGKDAPEQRPMREQIQAVRSFLRQVEELYGGYRGIELIGELPVSASTRVIYYVLKYERGPVYGVLSIYRTDNSEIVTGYAVNTELHKVVPPVLLVNSFNSSNGD